MSGNTDGKDNGHGTEDAVWLSFENSLSNEV